MKGGRDHDGEEKQQEKDDDNDDDDAKMRSFKYITRSVGQLQLPMSFLRTVHV